MPKFFSRRYMRGTPRRTERFLGAMALALTAGLVATFLLTSGLFKDTVERVPALARLKGAIGISEAPLFKADPRNLPAPPPAHEVRVARMLLPATVGDLKQVADSLHDAAADSQPGSAPADNQPACVFSAAYLTPAGELHVRILDLGEPRHAREHCLGAAASHPALTLGRGGWMDEQGHRAGFWSGRYYTELHAPALNRESLGKSARLLASLQLNYGDAAPAVSEVSSALKPKEDMPTPSGGPGPARFAEVKGSDLVTPSKVERYAENLYEKIDGKESAFRAFDVVDLKFGQYLDPKRQQVYDVYIYDMARPVNALGIYMSERVAKAPLVPIGREAYVSGTSVFFWKGQYYVNVLGPVDGGETALGAAKQVASAIDGTIADPGEPFWADTLLPAEDRVPNSLNYQASSGLGYEFLQRMFFAQYDAGGKTFQMYLTRAADAITAAETFKRFAEAAARYDKVLERGPVAGGELLVTETPVPGRPSSFGAAFHKGVYFGGVTECSEAGLAKARATAMCNRLSASDAGEAQAPHKADQSRQSAPSESDSSEGSEGGH